MLGQFILAKTLVVRKKNFISVCDLIIGRLDFYKDFDSFKILMLLLDSIDWLDDKTVFIAITYNPYNTMTTEAVKEAKNSKAKVILLTDTELNPIAHLADFLFNIHFPAFNLCISA